MFNTPPRSMVSTRSMKKEELRQAQENGGNNSHVREEIVEHRLSEKVEPNENRNQMCNTPVPSTAQGDLKPRSKMMSTTSSTAARRKRLELEAAEAKARIQFELIEKKLAADLADLEDDVSETAASVKIPTNTKNINERLVNEWLDKSIPEMKKQFENHENDTLAPAQPQTSAVGLAPNARSSPAVLAGDGTNGTVHALASALKDLAAASASGAKGHNNKMLSRLSVNKDLPIFSGEPLEWLQFKQAYEESTEVCSFSERENVWRLRKSLKGAAKDAVISLLIGATSPDIIISTLELQFGNPDVIVSRILHDLSKLRPLSPEYHKDIVPFAIKVKNCVAAVTSIGCEDYLKGMNIVSAILSKLPTVLISKWSDYSFSLSKNGTRPKLVIMSEFLNEEAVKITNSAVNLSYPHTFNKVYSENSKNRTLPVLVNDGPTSDNKCGFCSFSNHSLPDCRKFKKTLRKDRWTHVKRHGLCYKCMTSRHKQDVCSAPACDVDNCGMAHHRLLHYAVAKNSGQCNITEITDSESNTSPRVETVAHVNTNNCKVFLKTVPICLHGPNGTIQTYALLDDGSSVTLISDALVTRLGTRGSKQTMRVCGAWDNSELVCSTEIININLSNTAGTKYNISARSVKNLNLPVQNIYLMDINNYKLMKPEIKSVINNGQCKPELLIGQDNYDLLLPLEIIKGNSSGPYFTRTALGWCMHGCVRMKTSNADAKSTLLLTVGNESSTCEYIREMLRVLMSIFDIYGFLSPITIKGKIMLQDTWKSGISWDDEIDDVIFIKWLEWLNVMQKVHTIRLPRYYYAAAASSSTLDKASTCARETHDALSGGHAPNNEPPAPQLPLSSPAVHEARDYASSTGYTNLQLHIFCDASTKAMCATAYWRWIDNNNKQIRVAFIASKCRVLPVKYMSIPRAELMAALIAARLAKTIISEHRIQVQKKQFWCDSSTVLHWIRNDARNYKAFVAHRLGEIDELTDIYEWRYIPTKLNVADIATRDTCEIETLQKEWLYGPSFLYEEEHLWPRKSEIQLHDVSDVDLEHVNTVSLAPVGLPAVPEPERFSSWLRLVRSTSIMLTFINKCRRLTCEPSAMMEHAETLLLRYSQSKSFHEDLQNLKHNKGLEKKSRLLTLTPFLDKDSVLRLGGRIDSACDIDLGMKQPVILDGRCHVTHLIVKYYHVKACHGNQELVVNELKQRYWILKLRPTVKYISNKCMLCRIRRARPQPPRMGDLPEARVAHHQRPFTHTGLDLFGPLEVTIGRRREKRYGVIFTCLTVRAVHIELVHNLTTDALIMALRRMAARRGWPRFIYSDNGTNLRGADTEMRKCVQELEKNKLDVDVTSYSSATKWTFIPPGSPHWGGAWERLIRNIKTALKVVLKERAPREEILITLLAEIENMVNSRPLTHVSVEPNTQETLTPNHFLLGASYNTPALGMFNDTDTYLRRQWRISQTMADMFWRRWVREILPEMRPRTKWACEHRSLQVGDLVLIVDPNSPRNVWPKGLIQTILPGKDGRVRVVDVKTKSGVLRRPATRVALIPVDGECCTSTGEGDVGDAL